jgi:hypothetical protein
MDLMHLALAVLFIIHGYFFGRAYLRGKKISNLLLLTAFAMLTSAHLLMTWHVEVGLNVYLFHFDLAETFRLTALIISSLALLMHLLVKLRS